ncbi:Integrase catalytic region [Ktedonobacter racemifer DSM 44963]|uniref:Integrase catalytic region n=1 Tax=Ktedonobacter racemifer DSM 44963 TaxID=485913 RepID=D6TW60_KTERA|nr:Integrase catalytic region [Ktedonobacter racemifer DSM 44963]
MIEYPHEKERLIFTLQRVSLSARDYQSLRVVVLPFSLSFRDVEELMAERGVVLTSETVRQWCLNFGQMYANELRHRRAKPGDKWHLDEVFLTIKGKRQYLWRAVDQHGNMLDILVQSRRNKQAAKKFFRKLLKRLKYAPRVIITDKLASYAAAKKEILPSVEHRQHKGLNNRAENSHQPTRQRERTMISWSRSALPLGLWPHFRSFPTPKASSQRLRVSCAYTGTI